MDKKPNVVLFMMDQLSAKWLEAGLAGAVRLPNMQRLCKRGTRFTRAFTNNPVCSAARSSLLTGLTCRGHRVMENGTALNPAYPTFPKILAENGWKTASFGKLHLRPHYDGPYHDYTPYGFEEVQEVADPYAGPWLDWIKREHPAYYERALTLVWPLDVPGMRQYGKDGVDLTLRARQAQKAYPYRHPLHEGKPVREVYAMPLPDGLTPSDWITAHSIRYLRAQAQHTPFFLNISYVHPHNPFMPPERCLDAVDVSRIPGPLPPTWQDDPNHPLHFDFPQSYAGIPPYWRIVRQYYFACIAHLDEQLGKVMDALEETEQLENTCIILLADHGELLYDHGFLTKHNRHYDACIRIPLIIAGPGMRQNTVDDHPVSLLDIMPTVLALTGCPEPKPRTLPAYRVDEPYPSMLAGRSLLPLLGGEAPPHWPDHTYTESYSYWSNVRACHWARTVRTADTRYTYYPDGGGEEMFDLSADPDELHSVAADPAYAPRRAAMRDRLLEAVIMQDSPKDLQGPLFYHEHC